MSSILENYKMNHIIKKFKKEYPGWFADNRNFIGEEALNKVPKKFLENQSIDPYRDAIFCWQSNGYKFTWVNDNGELHTLKVDKFGDIDAANVINSYTSVTGTMMIMDLYRIWLRLEETFKDIYGHEFEKLNTMLKKLNNE